MRASKGISFSLSSCSSLLPKALVLLQRRSCRGPMEGNYFLRSSAGSSRGAAADLRSSAKPSNMSFRGGRGGSGSHDRIDALGRLLTRILRHMASELNLHIREDGYVRVRDLLQLNITTYAKVPIKSHTVDEIKEAVRRDNKQRFGLLEENGDLWIRANQGHTIVAVSSESLLRPILSADDAPVCVHGTYKKNLESILQSGLKRMQRLHIHFASGLPADGVISGMRSNINVLIFLDVRMALEDGMKLYISENKVILTEGFDGVVPPKYFQKIETWPGRRNIATRDGMKLYISENKVILTEGFDGVVPPKYFQKIETWPGRRNIPL